MERVRRIGEARRPVAAGFHAVKMRVEHNVRAAARLPADRLRMTPAFLANGDSELLFSDLE